MGHELSTATQRALDRRAVEAQRASRAPGLVAGVAHRGDLLWDAGVGAADLDDPSVPLGPDTQFLIASNTKTFTAVMVMQLRDEDRLRLDDPVDALLPGSDQPGVTVRQLLAHTSGMQREPVAAEFWDTLEVPQTRTFPRIGTPGAGSSSRASPGTTATSGSSRSVRSSPTSTTDRGPRACRRGRSTLSSCGTPP